MRNSNNLIKTVSFILFATGTTAEAALLSRVDGAAYYDTALDITWLADANLIASNPINTNLYTYTQANKTKKWFANYMIEELNESSYLGQNNWRLPKTGPINGISYNFSGASNIGESDWGSNISAPGTLYSGSTINEMANLFYNTLGNTYGSGGFKNTGPFTNLETNGYYITGTSFILNTYPRDFVFTFSSGSQFYTYSNSNSQQAFVWAVRDGDISAVPLPASLWLFMSGLMGFIAFNRKNRTGLTKN